MSGLLVSLGWCSLQVTLVALLAWLLCGLARRMSASHAAALPATALAAVIVLTALAFVPWPRAWSYGPELSWQEERILSTEEEESTSVEKGVPLERRPPLTPELNTKPAVVIPVEGKVNLKSRPIAASSPADSPPVSTPAPHLEMSPSVPSATTTLAPSPPLPRAWPWQSILLALLAIGAAVGLLQLLAGLVAAQSYRRKSSLIKDKGLHELADVLCAQLRCRARVELRETPALATAATIGWRKPEG